MNNTFVVLQGQRLRESTLLLPGKGVVEIVARTQRPVHILVVRRRFGKACVIVGDESRKEGVALRQGCRTCQPQSFDQAILQRLVSTFDAPFSRARVGADDVDVERVQGAAELGHPVTAKRAWMVDPEDPVLVAVEGDWLAPGL